MNHRRHAYSNKLNRTPFWWHNEKWFSTHDTEQIKKDVLQCQNAEQHGF